MRSATAPTPLESCSPDVSGAEQPLGIYIHWPFCQSKCPYCDFNSHVRGEIEETRWRRALGREIAYFAERTTGARVESIFLGGGTPSLMAPETVAAALEAVKRHWPSAPDLEVTLEANPSSVEADRFAGFRAAGVNRVSLGVQSLEDAALAFLGRLHSAREARRAVEVARETFDRVSIDLIYALPGQTPADWRDELTEALSLAGGHLSAYQLTIEADTAFARRHARGAFTLPDADTAAEMFDITQEMTAAAGLPAYEISNHARAGEACRHNLEIWKGGGYVGVGPGAHGRLPLGDGGAIATEQAKLPEAWLAKVEERGCGISHEEPIPGAARAEEAIMTGLRLTEGINARLFERRLGRPLDEVIDGIACKQLGESGHLVRDGDRLTATPSGRLLLDAVLGALLARS